MNNANPKLYFIIVISIAVMAMVGVSSLCLSLFVHVYADPSIMTAVLTLTSGLVATLAGFLTRMGGQDKPAPAPVSNPEQTKEIEK